jgi:hypothetical protein
VQVVVSSATCSRSSGNGQKKQQAVKQLFLLLLVEVCHSQLPVAQIDGVLQKLWSVPGSKCPKYM